MEYPPSGQPPQYPQQPSTSYTGQQPYYPPGQYMPPGIPPQQPYYPPQYAPPPQPKKSRAWLWIGGAGLVFLLMCMCMMIGGLASKSSNTATTQAITSQSDLATGSTTQAAKKWVTIKTFAGNGAKKTETFTVGNRWKINWECPGTHGIDGAPLYISVYKATGSVLDFNAVSTSCDAGKVTKDSSEEHEGGDVYLDVNSGIPWKITVQELK